MRPGGLRSRCPAGRRRTGCRPPSNSRRRRAGTRSCSELRPRSSGLWRSADVPRSRESPRRGAGLRTTVAHELAHVSHFSCVGSGRLPIWAAEGSAVALWHARRPGRAGPGRHQYLDAWLGSPWLPLYDERFSCSHCYGGAWWWLYLSGPEPAHAAELLRQARDRRPRGQEVDAHRRLAARRSAADEPRGLTGHRLREVLARPLPTRAPPRLGAHLNASTRIHATRALGVFGLSTHYIPVHAPARARGVVVAVPFGHGPAPSVAMIVGGPKGRRVPQRRRAEADRP